MPIQFLYKRFMLFLEQRQISPIYIGLLFLLPILVALSPSAQAQPVELGSGTLDAARVIGPKWTRINFEPSVSGDHVIRVASDTGADIRFSLFNLSNLRIGMSADTAPLDEWTGTLDTAEQYYLGVWVVTGSGSFTATIEPIPELEINTQPVSLTVTEDEDAVFTVAATGSGTLTYQWYLNDEAIDSETSDTYTLAGVAISDDGNVYRVDVFDSNGTLSSAGALLTVEPVVALEITTQPVNLAVTEGEDAVFTVAATGSGALTYQWYVNDEAVDGATMDTYTVAGTVSTDDGSVYRVQVTDDNSTLGSANALLEVAEQTVPFTVLNVGQGFVDSDKVAGPRWERINFNSLTTAVHTIRVVWDSDADVRFNVFEAGGTLISSTVQGTNPGVWSGNLEADTQYYIGTWSTSGIAHYNVTLEATVPITIVSQPFNRTVTEGDDVTFKVEATGSGVLSYQWFADGNPLLGETADSLDLLATLLDSSGTLYHVEVSNGLETVVSSMVTLTVNEPLNLGLFSQEADLSTWMLDGPAPTLDFNANENSDAWGNVLLRIDDMLLVGGDFEGIKPTRAASPTARPFLAALDAVSGQPLATFQVPGEVDGVVRALSLSPNGEQIYVGGDFGLLAIDAASGALEFTVSVTKSNDVGRVFDIAVDENQLYIGGDFNNVDNVFRANIARLSLDGQIDTQWQPRVTHGFNNGRSAPVQSLAISASGDTVYVGGNFRFIDSVPVLTTAQNNRISMLSLSAVDGSVLPERFFPDVGNNVKGLTAYDIVATEFYVIIAWGGPNFLSFHALDGTRLRQYRGRGDVQALQVVGNHVLVGHHGELFGTLINPIPQEAVVSLDPEIVLPFKFHSFRIDDPTFLTEQAWQITGAFGVWGIAAAEDSIWVAGQISRAGSNDRAVDGLVRFPAL